MVLCSVFDVVKKIAEKCVEPIVGYVKTEVGYLCNYKANVEKLRDEVVNMNAEITSMKARIQAENRSGKTEVDARADNWVKMMTSLIDEASKIIEEEERETERCLMGLRPNLWACYQASKSAKKVMDGADERKKEREKIITVAHIDHSQCLGFAINLDFEQLESRKSASEEIVAYLQDPSVKMVGMYGMGGTGKTTLAEKIGVQLYEDGTFRYVVKTVVSNNQNTDLIHIQKQIADLLQISFKNDKDDVMARAKQLREQLEKMDKVLIILDDIWSKFELTKVGIPLDWKLKILMTSRDEKVMNEMGSRHNVPLKVLSPEDSWKLFDRIADGVAPDSDRYSTAREVVEQCGGIPVLLVTIAIALRNEEDLEIWKEALFQLKKFEGDNFVEDGYKRLEVSYNFLPNDELRSLFLLCAQLDHRFIPIDDLLRYSMGLGLFDKREKLREVRSRLHMHLRHLKGYCLLQDGNRKGTVRMHDVIHKFAASIVNKDRGISSTVAEAQLQEWPSKDKVVQFSISLPHRHLPPPDHQLPVAFDSSKLESFLLLRGKDYDLLNVPDEFFIGMKELKLIDIRRMSLSPVLCSSLNVLVKLRTLCLDNCALDDIAVIGELPMLQVLSLKGSTVSQIERLGSNLKLLDLRDCGQLKVIASGVFCNLTLLEDLRIGDRSFGKWEPLQGCNSGSDHETSTTKKLASLREFKDLGNLINLDIKIPDPKTFPKELVFGKLERFNLVIGDVCQPSWFLNDSETLKVKLDEDIQLYEGIKVLMRKAKKLDLEGIQGVTSVCELLDMRELERMCDDHRMLPVGSLQNLTSIYVSSCNVLKYLFSSHLALRGLLCLKEIYVAGCESMESIVSRVSENRTVDNQLDEEEEIIEFTQLRILDLSSLPRLISFYSSGNSTTNPTISSSQGRQEHIQRLPNFLLNKKLAFPNLEQLQIHDIYKVKMIWENQLFLNLREVIVRSCPNLTSIFPASVALALKQLKYLTISDCENLKEIVSNEEEEDGGPTFVFPRLVFLSLMRLPEFERFYGGGVDISDWPSLGELYVSFCDKLIDLSNLNIQKIISPSLKGCLMMGTNFMVTYESWSGELKVDGDIQKIGCSSVFPIAPFEMFQKLEIFQELKKVHIARVCFEQLFPCEHDVGDDQFDGIPLNLEILEVESCGSLMSLAPKSALFQNLTSLVVWRCNELIKLVASSTTAKSLVNLIEMWVIECDSLKEIVAIYDDHDREEASNNTIEDIVFGKLKTLVLGPLRSLTSFTTNNCNFQFPSLEHVSVAECPNMEFFSRGALSTPKLSVVWIENERKMLESGLNSTVRQLYKAMNSTDEYLEPE